MLPSGLWAPPNTMLVSPLLSEDVIFCCGEDDEEMMKAWVGAGMGKPLEEHTYRSYKVRKYSDVTLIWSGIGTGCLEPLLYEVLGFGLAKRLVLVGTAGQITGRQTRVGSAYVINEAYVSGTGVDREVGSGALHPSFHFTGEYPTAAIVSTDFYYGFSDNPVHAHYHRSLPKLQEDFLRFREFVDLVDMEVGQFYAFCRMMAKPGMEYIAVKGPANTLANQEEQGLHADSVLSQSFSLGLKLLNL